MGITRNQAAEWNHWQGAEVKIIDDRAIRFSDVCVHEFSVGDVEDPEIYAGQPIWDWQQSEAGQWVMANAIEVPYWIKSTDYSNWGTRFKIMARLSEQNQTFWSLKWAGNKK